MSDWKEPIIGSILILVFALLAVIGFGAALGIAERVHAWIAP